MRFDFKFLHSTFREIKKINCSVFTFPFIVFLLDSIKTQSIINHRQPYVLLNVSRSGGVSLPAFWWCFIFVWCTILLRVVGVVNGCQVKPVYLRFIRNASDINRVNPGSLVTKKHRINCKGMCRRKIASIF